MLYTTRAMTVVHLSQNCVCMCVRQQMVVGGEVCNVRGEWVQLPCSFSWAQAAAQHSIHRQATLRHS